MVENQFILKEEHIEYPVAGEPAKVSLPSGVCEILLEGAKVYEHSCRFFGVPNTVLAQAGELLDYIQHPAYWSAEALITMNEMGYDLTDINELKRINQEDREKEKEKIRNEYGRLVKEKPEIFRVPD